MKGDFTRQNSRFGKAYSSVRMQQGRVQLDSDWNEQVEIELYRQRRLLRDLVGPGGVPADESSQVGKNNLDEFSLIFDGATSTTLTIGLGSYLVDDNIVSRAYVDGEVVKHVYPTMPVTIDAAPAGTQYWTIHVPSMILPDGRSIVSPGMWLALVRDDYLEGDRVPVILCPTVTQTANTITVAIYYSARYFTKTWGPTTGRLMALYTYDAQPYYPKPPALPSSGRAAAYLDVWQRPVTAVEDPTLLEAALGGIDTTTRTQTIWQVKYFVPTDPSTIDDGTWIHAVATQPQGTLAARYNPAPGQAQALENRLYRVEVHNGGTAGTVTFKWSRDNGSQLAAWVGGSGPLAVATQGRDAALGFAQGQWIELLNDERELKNLPGTFVQINGAPSVISGGQSLPITVPAGADATYTNYTGTPKVRRWDNNGATSYPPSIVPTDPMHPWIPLENGIEVQFDQTATYQTGDYWLIPARPNEGGIEWPQAAGQPLPQPCQRIEHRYLPLGALFFNLFGASNSTDLRPLFYSLAKLFDRLTAPVFHTMPIIPAFLPMTNSSGTALPAWKLVDESGIQWNPYALSTGNGEIGIIPLQLPDGAVFVELTVVNGNSGHGTVTLFQAQNKGQGLAVKIGEADLTTATSIYIISLGGAAPVDNLTYSYYLQAKGTTGSSVSIYGITLSYNSSILLPPL